MLLNACLRMPPTPQVQEESSDFDIQGLSAGCGAPSGLKYKIRPRFKVEGSDSAWGLKR